MTAAALVCFSLFYSFTFGLGSQFSLPWVSPWSFISSESYFLQLYFYFRFIVQMCAVCCCCSVAKLCLTICNPMNCMQPLSMGFPRHRYWSGLPFPSPGDLHNPDVQPASPALRADSLVLSQQGGPQLANQNQFLYSMPI